MFIVGLGRNFKGGAAAQLVIFPPQGHTTQGRQGYIRREHNRFPHNHKCLGFSALKIFFFPSTCSVSVLQFLACMFKIPCHHNDVLLLRSSAGLLCHPCFLVEMDSDSIFLS